jgi:hypothetical protein
MKYLLILIALLVLLGAGWGISPYGSPEYGSGQYGLGQYGSVDISTPTPTEVLRESGVAALTEAGTAWYKE